MRRRRARCLDNVSPLPLFNSMDTDSFKPLMPASTVVGHGGHDRDRRAGREGRRTPLETTGLTAKADTLEVP